MNDKKLEPLRVRKGGKDKKTPKVPGKPKKKTAVLLLEAHKRAVDLGAIRAGNNPRQRRVGEDCMVRTWIDGEWLVAESELQDLMWVQYRYETPLERTERFTLLYIAAYRRAYAKHFDAAMAARKQPADPIYVRNSPGDMNALWKARINADIQGVPYEIYLDAVMEGKLGNLKWTNPPMPNQLYGRHDPARMRGRPTLDEIATRLYADDWDGRFFVDAYQGDPVQEAALALLRTDVLAADDRALQLSVYMADRRAITESRARTMFDAGVVDAAITIAGEIKPPQKLDDLTQYRPPCFGYPNWLSTSPCLRCPVVRECRQHVEDTLAELTSLAGSSNPRLTTEREQTAARQRRWYNKQKVKGSRKD